MTDDELTRETRRRTWRHLEATLGSKWTLRVLRRLATGDARFNELRRDVGGVTAKTLSARLDDLRCAGLVARTVHATSPPATSYALTDPGREFAAVLERLEPLVSVVDCGSTADDECGERCDVVTVDAATTRTACAECC